MQQTERLYFHDSGLLDFTATIVEVTSLPEGNSIVLDRTAFYPTGGGQPNDIGWIGDAKVVDVFEDEAGIIYHAIGPAASFSPGQQVTATIDGRRRLDHMQQHSGQHILSQAFVQACGAETRSFHLGAQTSTIDIELKSPDDQIMHAAEDIANAIVFENRPMRVHIVSQEEAARLPLRKEVSVKGSVRVIEIEDFDWSPCGGTHATRTGQIGLIAIRSYERAKGMTRVEFVCGGRALDEYRRTRETSFAVARLLSAERDSTPELVARTLQENKSLKKRVRDLLGPAMTAEAAELLAVADASSGFKLVQAIFDARDFEELRVLALKIVQREPSIALLATKEGSAARLVFARSASLQQNMGSLLSEACEILGGRGGGKPDLAQGGGPSVERLQEAMSTATAKIEAP